MEDVAGPIYHVIDWNRSVVGGSYALQQYTKDTWDPHDIDIMYQCSKYSEFVIELERIQTELGDRMKIKQITLVTDEMRNRDPPGREERFHESIIATSTFEVKDVPKPIQLIGIKPERPMHFVDWLDQITDLPACILYRMDGNRRVFNVPQRCLNAIHTRQISRLDICADRREKYSQRGYRFDD